MLQLEGANGSHQKWGRFTPSQRYNADQVLLPFVINLKNTMEESGKKVVWVRQNHAGLDKRFCTLKLCFQPTGNQPKPTVKFRGLGKKYLLWKKQAGMIESMLCFNRKHGQIENLPTNVPMNTFVPSSMLIILMKRHCYFVMVWIHIKQGCFWIFSETKDASGVFHLLNALTMSKQSIQVLVHKQKC